MILMSFASGLLLLALLSTPFAAEAQSPKAEQSNVQSVESTAQLIGVLSELEHFHKICIP